MAIAHVSGQSGKAVASTGTGVQRAYGANVATGSLVTIGCIKYNSSGDTFVAGDCIKQAGTATIDTPTLDHQRQFSDGDGGVIDVGAWSAIVTAGGSLTLRVQGALASTYLTLFTDEFSGSWDASRVDGTPAGNSSATNGQSAASSGNVTTASAGLIVGYLAISTASSGFVMTQDAAFTEIASEQDGTTNMVAEGIYRIVGSGTTDDASWVIGTGNVGWGAIAVAYKEASGGGGGIVIPVVQHHRRLMGMS